MKNQNSLAEKMVRKVGLARVSTADQCVDLQVNALRAFGCGEIFIEEGVSGGIHPQSRPILCEAVSALGPNDILAVWKLDRIGRSLGTIIETIDDINAAGIQFVSLTENVDTTTATGRAFWQFIGLMAELERELIRERTIEGLHAARMRGVKLGRKFKLSDDEIVAAYDLMRTGKHTVPDIAFEMGVSRQTLQRGLARLELSV